jgi:hypothetical protein
MFTPGRTPVYGLLPGVVLGISQMSGVGAVALEGE